MRRLVFAIWGSSYFKFVLLSLIIGLAGGLLFRYLVKKKESAFPFSINQLGDPLEVAYFCGGYCELVRLSLFNLFLQGRLEVLNLTIKAKETGQDEKTKHLAPLSLFEAAILKKCSTAIAPRLVFMDHSLFEVSEQYKTSLMQKKLFASPQMIAERLTLFFAFLFLALIIPILRAFHNTNSLTFYFTLIIVLMLLRFLWSIYRSPRTGMGDKVQDYLWNFFSRRKIQASQLPALQKSGELLFSLAVLGVHTAPLERFSFLKFLYPSDISNKFNGVKYCGFRSRGFGRPSVFNSNYGSWGNSSHADWSSNWGEESWFDSGSDLGDFGGGDSSGD